MKLHKQRIVIIGGSSGIGFATAEAAYQQGAEIVIVGRSFEKLNTAKNKLGGDVIIKSANLLDDKSLEKLFKEIGHFDHLQLPGSDLKTGSFLTIDTVTAKNSFESKFWGPYAAAKIAHPYINKNGSITFYSGSYSLRPAKAGSAIAAAINSAIEGLTRALAFELAPLRINAVSPGLTLTERFTHHYSPEEIKSMTNQFCESLIIKRPADVNEIAQGAIYLMSNTYLTATTLFIDGGYTFR